MRRPPHAPRPPGPHPAEDRAFAVTALTDAAVTAATWRRVLGIEPITVAFPGGNEKV